MVKKTNLLSTVVNSFISLKFIQNSHHLLRYLYKLFYLSIKFNSKIIHEVFKVIRAISFRIELNLLCISFVIYRARLPRKPIRQWPFAHCF